MVRVTDLDLAFLAYLPAHGYLAALPSCTSCGRHMHAFKRPRDPDRGGGVWTCGNCSASMTGEMAAKVREALRLARSEYRTVLPVGEAEAA